MTEKEKIKKILTAIQANNDGSTIDFAVPGYAAKRVIAYQSMRSDLIQCRESVVELFNKKNNDIIRSSLFHTIVILYGKCFTDATSSKSPKLELVDFGQNKSVIPFHEELMDMRHNFVAHRGSSKHDLGVAFLSLGVGDLSRQVRVRQVKRKSLDENRLLNYIELFDFLIRIVEEKFRKEAEKLWNHMLQKYTPNQIAVLKIAGPTGEKE